MGIGGVGIVLVIIILFSSGTIVYAAPSDSNPGRPFEEILDELKIIKEEVAIIKEEVAIIKNEVAIIREDIEKLKELSSTDFEFEIDSSSSPRGAIAYTIYGQCQLGAGECESFSINKIVAPPISNAIFFGLCVDHFNCNILQDQNYKIGYSVEGGFSLAAHGAGGAGADVNGPIYPILPTNILTVSGLGETSASKVMTVMDISVTPQEIQNGLKGPVKFVGERPLDMKMFGWYLDFDENNQFALTFHCFEQDSVTGEISDELSPEDCEALQLEALPNRDLIECFDINLLPTIDFSQIEAVLSAKEIQNIKLPLKTKSIEICTDGVYEKVAVDGFFDDFRLLLNPVGSIGKLGDFCGVSTDEFNLDKLECDILKLNTADASPIIDARTIKNIEMALGSIKVIVDDILRCVEDILPCIEGDGGGPEKTPLEQCFATSTNRFNDDRSSCQNTLNSCKSNCSGLTAFACKLVCDGEKVTCDTVADTNRAARDAICVTDNPGIVETSSAFTDIGNTSTSSDTSINEN